MNMRVLSVRSTLRRQSHSQTGAACRALYVERSDELGDPSRLSIEQRRSSWLSRQAQQPVSQGLFLRAWQAVAVYCRTESIVTRAKPPIDAVIFCRKLRVSDPGVCTRRIELHCCSGNVSDALPNMKIVAGPMLYTSRGPDLLDAAKLATVTLWQ